MGSCDRFVSSEHANIDSMWYTDIHFMKCIFYKCVYMQTRAHPIGMVIRTNGFLVMTKPFETFYKLYDERMRCILCIAKLMNCMYIFKWMYGIRAFYILLSKICLKVICKPQVYTFILNYQQTRIWAIFYFIHIILRGIDAQ